MNPLMNQNPNQQINPMQNLISMLQGGANPQQLAQNILNSNPQAGQLIQSLQHQCGDQNPRDFVLNLCRQNGCDMNYVMSIANSMGLR